MRIQHNIMAMNSYRNLGGNNTALSKNLEKLSSGYRINRAGDDAAGLAISEKMRAQIAGLDQAQKNAQSGINLVKTAEGALTEVHDMLNRMVTLASQSANGTYTKTDREKLQAEIDALTAEIDRIADNSNFNGTKLLDGSLAATEVEGGIPESAEIQDVTVTGDGATVSENPATGNKYEATSTATMASNAFDAIQIKYTNAEGVEKTLTLVESTAGNVTEGTTSASAGETIATALNNKALALSNVSDTNAKADYAEFLELFTVSGAGDKLTITAKDVNSVAKVTDVQIGDDTANANAALGDLTSLGGTTKAAEAANVTVKVTVGTDTSASITIGGKEYVVSDDAKAGDAAAKAADLLKQLKADGYDVELDADDNTKIKFKDLSQLQEAQKGAEIVNSADDKWDVNADASTKGKVEFTLATATAATTDTDTIVFNYVNEKGEAVSKEIKFDDGNANTAGNAAAAFKAAFEADADLGKLFKVTTTGTNDDVTIESKGSGTAAGYITGVSSPDAATIDATSKKIQITEPKDVGKVLTMAKKVGTNTAEVIKDGDQITIDGKTYQFMADTGKSVDAGVVKVALDSADTEQTWKNLQAALKENGVESELHKTSGTVDGLRFTDSDAAVEAQKDGGLQLQIGADAVETIKVTVESMKAGDLGIADLDIGDVKSANAAIDTIKNAIEKVSVTRGNLGAVQNRLEHTINNLGVMEENITDAESNIRDTDIADEMMAYTKNNILIQSAQAMLAQANQVPQGVLQLMG